MLSRLVLLIFVLTIRLESIFGGILQPQSSETREVLSLNGLWYFTTNASFADNVEYADDLDINLMPVPSSYNDISTRLSLRDHVGSVWYQRTFYVPRTWSDKKVWIRFGSVCYNASVTINGQVVVTHQIGHLPFQAEISSAVNFGKENIITVEVNNILTPVTIPQGEVVTLISGRLKQKYDYDFFNYAGIDRPVVLYTTSNTAYVDDINIYTQLNGTSGLGRHEDSDFRGRGLDFPLIIRDHNLIKWVGANCYRTSHYPYAEEIMDMADQLGIMIIDEVPAVNTGDYTDELLENHKTAVTELYRRDKNRPSVVLWSMANEPQTDLAKSEDYYRQVVAHIKTLDSSRPVTIVNSREYDIEHSGQFLDILSFNYYASWYANTGDVDGIYEVILGQARGWRNMHNKPVIMTEYGADSLSGLSILPSAAWSEEYQLDLMEQFFRAFDELRSEGWFVGEMIWNFAEFKTDQNIKRVGGNRKGIFTRNRQPKASAFLLRKRYWALAELLNNVTVPSDLDKYVLDSDHFKVEHDEL